MRRTSKVRQLPDETEQASPWILHDVLSGCSASSHRFWFQVERVVLNALVGMDAAFAA